MMALTIFCLFCILRIVSNTLKNNDKKKKHDLTCRKTNESTGNMLTNLKSIIQEVLTSLALLHQGLLKLNM